MTKEEPDYRGDQFKIKILFNIILIIGQMRTKKTQSSSAFYYVIRVCKSEAEASAHATHRLLEFSHGHLFISLCV